MAETGSRPISSRPLTDADRAKIAEREAVVRRWLKQVIRSPGFDYFCGLDRPDNSAGGIVREWTFQFWRASAGFSGRLLLFDSAWDVMSYAMNYSPMALLPHVKAGMSAWEPVGAGPHSAAICFYSVEFVNGAARPVRVPGTIIPTFDTSAYTDLAEWLGWSGGKPRHHLHPPPLAIEFGSNMHSVVRGTTKAIGFEVTGGARAYTLEELLSRDWVTITGGLGGYTLNLNPMDHVPLQMYPVVIKVTDALGQTDQFAPRHHRGRGELKERHMGFPNPKKMVEKEVRKAVGRIIEPAARAAKSAVNKVADGAQSGLRRVGQEAENTVKKVGHEAEETVKKVGREAEDELRGVGREIEDGITEKLPELIEHVAEELAEEATEKAIKEALDNGADVIEMMAPDRFTLIFGIELALVVQGEVTVAVVFPNPAAKLTEIRKWAKNPPSGRAQIMACIKDFGPESLSVEAKVSGNGIAAEWSGEDKYDRVDAFLEKHGVD